MRTEFGFYSPVKVVTGIGKSHDMKRWAEEFHAKKMLVITGRHVSKSEEFQDFTAFMKKQGLTFEVYAETVPEPPIEAVDLLADYIRAEAFEMAIAVGGGSPMDTAKAVCMLKNNSGSIKEYLFGGKKVPLNPSMPLIYIPTTAGSGSEVTASSVIEDTENNVKLSCTHPFLFAKAAILDPLLQKDMPPKVTAGTGMDAMTHAIEAYTSKNASAFSDIYARRAIELIAQYLPLVMKNGEDLHARMMMAQASTMAAIAFLNGGLGAVHGISQSMGGIAHTPHGISNAVLLPAVMKYNYSGNVEKFAEIAGFLGCGTGNMHSEVAAREAVRQIIDLNCRIGIKEGISELGVTRDMFPHIAKETMKYRLLWMNPVEFTEEMVMHVLEESFESK